MRRPRLVFIMGYGGQEVPLLKRIVEEESRRLWFEGIVISVVHRPDAASKHKDVIASADAILIHSYELPEDVINAIRSSTARTVVPTSDMMLSLARGDPSTIRQILTYFRYGGERNLRNMVRLILRSLGVDVTVEPVEEVPLHGIYHPVLGVFRDVDEYLRRYREAYGERPMVCLLFYRTYWLYGSREYVDELVRALESEGLGVIPVFTTGWRYEEINSPTKEDSIREFFLKDGRPIIDVLVNLSFFFLLDHGPWHTRSDRFKVVQGVELLKLLNAPIISVAISFYRSVDEWLEDPQGLDYMSQVYTVIMPEVDGLVEPIYYVGARIDEYGVRRFEPFRPHAVYIAKRVRRWVELRRKPPSERRIAIVLINPPCKGLEANVAVGFGLDPLESVARLLKRLAELGYNVGDPTRLPRDGRELAKMILERRAISEFRWTSVEEIVRRGGAVGFVDEETYLRWFNELPSDVREKMIRDWGHPSDVLRGRVSKTLVGMVYQDKFVIPGLLFGNVLITPQPKFGCAGPRCDGKTCRVLHDPTIAPPHQWLAVYRWITRVFGADVVIHFGTHGYLEFRPGKGVGLSPSCWPEVSIDDVPHLYVYVVSNPMEGVIAKRRGYATIVDHLYPPMAMAEALERLESLVNQYWRAKHVGDLARAEVVYKEILEEARRNNVRIQEGGPDEAVKSVHRYLEMVRSTQIEMGLHVFGHSPEDLNTLARYAATVLSFDTPTVPSIRRVIVEALGLDYDWVRESPEAVNKLGLTNSETLELAHRMAVRVLERLIENPKLIDKVYELVLEEARREGVAV